MSIVSQLKKIINIVHLPTWIWVSRATLVTALKWSEVDQSCPTLCDPMDCSLPGSSIHGIFQARVLEWVAIQFSSVQFSRSVVSNSLWPPWIAAWFKSWLTYHGYVILVKLLRLFSKIIWETRAGGKLFTKFQSDFSCLQTNAEITYFIQLVVTQDMVYKKV